MSRYIFQCELCTPTDLLCDWPGTILCNELWYVLMLDGMWNYKSLMIGSILSNIEGRWPQNVSGMLGDMRSHWVEHFSQALIPFVHKCLCVLDTDKGLCIAWLKSGQVYIWLTPMTLSFILIKWTCGIVHVIRWKYVNDKYSILWS